VHAQLPPIEAHDVLVKSGGMSQILLWTSFLEIFGGIALFQTIQGKRYPGDFQFDPLGLSQVQTSGVCVCMEWRGVLKEVCWAVGS
jgi:hypothetical protein